MKLEVLEFFDNDRCRPAKAGEYLVISKNKTYHALYFSTRLNRWNVFEKDDMPCIIDVLCWAELPDINKVLTNMVLEEKEV